MIESMLQQARERNIYSQNVKKLMGIRFIWNRLWNITKELPNGTKIGYTWAVSIDGIPIEKTKLYAVIKPNIHAPKVVQGIGGIPKRETIPKPKGLENKTSGCFITDNKEIAQLWAKKKE